MQCKPKELTKNLILHCMIILTGTALVIGYNFAVLNQPSNHIQTFFNETYVERNGSISSGLLTLLWSMAASIMFVGCILGAITSGFLTKRYGRKKTVMSTCIIQVIGCMLQVVGVFIKSPELLIIGRFIIGFSGDCCWDDRHANTFSTTADCISQRIFAECSKKKTEGICGSGIGSLGDQWIASHAVPIYTAECSPIKVRGTVGSWYQFIISIGLIAAAILGIKELFGTSSLWKYLLILPIIPTAISFIALFFLPDSPRYLMFDKKDELAARKALKFLLRKEDIDDFVKDMEIEHSKEMLAKKEHYTLLKILKEKSLRKPLAIVLILPVFLQFSGVTVLIIFSVGIFQNAGVLPDQIQYAVIIQNLINLITTAVGVLLVDKLRRKTLLLYPSIVNAIILGLLTVSIHLQPKYVWLNYVSIVCIAVSTGCFSIGPGILGWFVGAELFKQGPRDVAYAVFGVALWICVIVVSFSFEFIVKAIGEFSFIIFMVVTAILTIFLFFKLPETGNKAFHEIAAEFDTKEDGSSDPMPLNEKHD